MLKEINLHSKTLPARHHLPRSSLSLMIQISRSEMNAKHNPGQFQKGLIPWNKGMRGLPSKGRMQDTQFRPGNQPANWKPVGSTRINVEGYVEIKIAEGKNKYRLLHREVWKQHHGSYPPRSHVLIFINGNRQDCDINNLKLVTRKELMAMNTVHRLPENLKKVIRLKGVLKRKINGK
ncbi:HNH endonuclease signature motif containing protein [Nitrosomonas sp.]|uniref:HNH endonuclease signature motif containing protein n=1 Tax=Nitrosomonas sp. TaxID=42353 RepID=UPI0037CC94E1